MCTIIFSLACFCRSKFYRQTLLFSGITSPEINVILCCDPMCTIIILSACFCKSKFYRQTLLFSGITSPEINVILCCDPMCTIIILSACFCRSKFYRQTLLFSGITSPEINALFNKHCHSILLSKHFTREIHLSPESIPGKLFNEGMVYITI